MSSDRSDESEQRLRHRTSVGYRSGLFIRKEMRETLRDRRTIITLLAMPLLLYPLLGMVFRFLAISQAKRTAAPEYVVAVSTDVEALWLTSSVEFGDRILKGRAARAAAAFSSIPGSSAESGAVDGTAGTGPGSDGSMTPDASQVSVTGASGGAAVQSGAQRSGPPGPSDNSPRLRIYSASDPAGMNLSEEIASGEADLGVQVELQNWTGTVQTMQPAAVRLITNRDSPLSREAQRYVEECLQAASTSIVLNQARQYDRSIRLPVRITRDAVDSSQKSRGFLGLLPLVLLLMTVTGGVYPAIDLTAGERERDTLETLIALPVPKVHLLLAKFVAVFTVTLLTGLVNILAMTATVYSLQMENQLFGEGGLSLRIALSLLFILTVFGLFYSAVLLALTSASRSFKEAQAYLIPLMLMSIAPGLVILLPGWHLDGWVAVVPLVNMLLLARDVFEGTARTVPAMIAIISTLAYASCALTLAARIFGTDAIAVGSRGTRLPLAVAGRGPTCSGVRRMDRPLQHPARP